MATTMTAREFNHDTARAKRATENGPVVVTDRGTPSHVLLSYSEFRRLIGSPSAANRSPNNRFKLLPSGPADHIVTSEMVEDALNELD